MAAVIKIICNSYDGFEKENSDPRTSDFLFMTSVFYPLSIIGVYYYIVRHLGPQLMANREPFNLKNIILIYNIVQVVLNFVMCCSICYVWVIDDYKFVCEPVDKYYEKHTMGVQVTWFYFIVKLLDLLDTVFFILRKKDKQVTFLHIYHHSAVVFFVWFAVKYTPDGHIVLLGLLNTGVHSVMYLYYLISNWNPHYVTIEMKKYVTLMQMLQFLILILQNALGLFKKDCKFPKPMIMICLIQVTFMFFMFYDFYRRTYRKKKPQ